MRGARGVLVLIILSGLGSVAYFQSTMTALIFEGVIGQAWRKKRMKSTIAGVRGHVVVAGIGSTGRHVVEELIATGPPFIAIDKNREHLQRLSDELHGGQMLFVHGDATEDHTLIEAASARRASSPR
ncbi:MAG: NAD-binding protein [Polyangiaceae bacterium]|nr:NAD-binding protein [Polyangiaceae bacterium]